MRHYADTLASVHYLLPGVPSCRWELSWDVMEPFGYIISLFYSLVGYTYFLATKGKTFDLEPFKTFWHQRIKVGAVTHLFLESLLATRQATSASS